MLEVLRTLRRYELTHVLSADASSAFAGEVRDAQVRYHSPDAQVLDVVWRHRHNLSPYDAPYVALAQIHDVPLVTHDERLARAARVLGVMVLP